MMIPMFMPGHWEILIVVFVILLLFGGRKIPEMMKGLGTGIREFKKGVAEDEQEAAKQVSEKGSGEEKKSSGESSAASETKD